MTLHHLCRVKITDNGRIMIGVLVFRHLEIAKELPWVRIEATNRYTGPVNQICQTKYACYLDQGEQLYEIRPKTIRVCSKNFKNFKSF